MKNANDWQAKMYDEGFIQQQLDSPYFKDFAQKEVDFIIQKLGLKAGMNLLDIPCGAGRHSAEFAKRKISVTALDINPKCVKYAKKNSKGLDVIAKLGNLIDLKKYKKQFDATVNLFSSFGYFSTDAENEKVMKELISTLKPGGKLAIHLIERNWLMKVFQPVTWREVDGVLKLEARKYDPKTYYNETHAITLDQKTGKGKTDYHRIRLYSKKEIVAMMKRCGLTQIKVYPAASEESFSKQMNSHPLYVGTRKR